MGFLVCCIPYYVYSCNNNNNNNKKFDRISLNGMTKTVGARMQTSECTSVLYAHSVLFPYFSLTVWSQRFLECCFCNFILWLQYHTILFKTILTNNEDSTQVTKQFLTSHVTCRIPHRSFYYGAGHSIRANLHLSNSAITQSQLRTFQITINKQL